LSYTQGGTSSGRGINSNDFAIEMRGRKRFSLGFNKPSSEPNLAATNATTPTPPPPAVRPKRAASAITVTPIPGLKLSHQTLDELLPVRTQGFSRSLARLGE